MVFVGCQPFLFIGVCIDCYFCFNQNVAKSIKRAQVDGRSMNDDMITVEMVIFVLQTYMVIMPAVVAFVALVVLPIEDVLVK